MTKLNVFGILISFALFSAANLRMRQLLRRDDKSVSYLMTRSGEMTGLHRRYYTEARAKGWSRFWVYLSTSIVSLGGNLDVWPGHLQH